MVFKQTVYSVLVASASGGFVALMADLLPMTDYWPVTVADSAAAARRILQERTYDLVLINTPLPDDFGINLAMEVCGGTDAAVAVFVKRERYKEASARLTGHGILTVARPTTRQMVLQKLQALQAMRERMRTKVEQLASMEDQMCQLQFVNRAQWLLIEQHGMTEEELTAASRGERWMPISLREKPRSGSFGNIAAKKAWMPKRANLQPQIPIASERLA